MDEPRRPDHQPEKPRRPSRRARRWITVGVIIAATLVLVGLSVVALFVLSLQAWAGNK